MLLKAPLVQRTPKAHGAKNLLEADMWTDGCCVALLSAVFVAAAGRAGANPHAVRQLTGDGRETALPADLKIVTEHWNRVVAVPYIVYMPERQRLLMLIACDYPHMAAVTISSDHGATWSAPRYLATDAAGKPLVSMATGLTCLGHGTLMVTNGPQHRFSYDYGETWTTVLPNPPASNARTWYEWDPPLVTQRPGSAGGARLMSFCSDNLQPDGHFQGYIRFSDDGGRSWHGEIKVPEMARVNEAAFLRAADGSIVAACRTDNPDRFHGQIDHYGGLAVSMSKDEGLTWSALTVLYEWGRHHPSMLLLGNGDIVMTYVVRKGYTRSDAGFPQFGVEAVVSVDNGRTWDLDHRYILHTWEGHLQGNQEWWPSSQATSTVLLDDGTLLTVFGTGYRCRTGPDGRPAPRDVGLIRWRLGKKPGKAGGPITEASPHSDLRNLFDPVKGTPAIAADAAQ